MKIRRLKVARDPIVRDTWRLEWLFRRFVRENPGAKTGAIEFVQQARQHGRTARVTRITVGPSRD
jgi:hypothetical protein